MGKNKKQNKKQKQKGRAPLLGLVKSIYYNQRSRVYLATNTDNGDDVVVDNSHRLGIASCQ